MTGTAEFLRLVLPEDGWKCLHALPGKPRWFADLDKMAEAALAADLSGRQAIYHACASFKEKTRRTQENVHALKAFWFDLDVGVDRPYADLPAAYRALQEWRATCQLPAPLVVGSGGGLHAYWPLLAAIDRARWLPAAMGLRALALEHGLQIDPGVTVDAARILRTPGTHNRKRYDAAGKKVSDVGGPPRPVVAGPRVPANDVGVFEPLRATNTVTPLGVPPPFLKKSSSLEDNLIWRPVHADSDPEIIAANCAQVRRLRDAHGRLPEPEWYAVLGVLGHAGGVGRTLAHAWSSGDDRYVAGDTERKLDQATMAAGPTTCGRFETLNPAGCRGCPSRGKVTSPIELGRALPASTLAEKPAVRTLPPLPSPFFWHQGKLKVRLEPKSPEEPQVDLIVAEYPVYMSELQRGERSEGVSGVFQSWEPMESSWREFVMPLDKAIGDRGASAFAGHAVAIPKKKWPFFADYVVAQTNHHRGLRPYGTRWDQFGWKLEGPVPGFVVGEDFITAVGTARAFGSPEVTRRAKLMAAQGTVVAWRAAAEALFAAPGMEGHAFALLCAFAAPLHRFTGEDGGTVVHLFSRESGTGKTTALEAAASVWGSVPAIALQEKDTTNAKFVSLGTLAHLPVVYDEFRAPDPETIKEFVLHFTIGRDKQRASADGGLRSDNLPWSTLLVTAANISAIDVCRWDTSEVAQAARIFEYEIRLPPDLQRADASALKETLKANRGTAGRAYVAHALANLDFVKRAVPQMVAKLEVELGAGPGARYIVRLLACVVVAGMLCRDAGVLTFDMDRINRWAKEIAAGNRVQVGAGESVDIGNILGALINDLAPATLVMPGPQRAGKDMQYREITKPRGELLARYEVEGKRIYIDERAARAWFVKARHPYSQVVKLLLAQKVIMRTGYKKTLGAGAAMPGGQVRTLEIDGLHPMVAEALETLEVVPVETNVVEFRR